MGIGLMDELGIDQSRTSKTITWGEDIEVPMVPHGYWTEMRIQKICSKSSIEKQEISAVYDGPDLLEVIKRNGSNLTMSQ